MLRAHENMPTNEFVAQLRTFVIALGLSPQVIDQVDNLDGAHEEELNKVEEEAEERGRESMKEEILAAVNRWIEDQPDYEKIGDASEAIVALIEKV